jgi:uncharacterized iron-regulated protein
MRESIQVCWFKKNMFSGVRIMIRKILSVMLAMICASCLPITDKKETPSVFDVGGGRKITLSQAVGEWRKNRMLVVGEQHDNKSHHVGQLKVIQALHEAGVKVAVGLEMFRQDSQADLDRWIAGDMNPEEFQKIYYDNWNFQWHLYGMIFDYARENGIPMVGLNVPREITRQVAYDGFQSLSEEQRGKLSDVVCDVDDTYLKYIQEVYGSHAHGHMNFAHFCEAQLVWDNVMAIRSLDYIRENPDRVIVLLTGTGHARKPGIPMQVWKRSDVSLAVILPEIPEIFEPGRISAADADYLLVNPD